MEVPFERQEEQEHEEVVMDLQTRKRSQLVTTTNNVQSPTSSTTSSDDNDADSTTSDEFTSYSNYANVENSPSLNTHITTTTTTVLNGESHTIIEGRSVTEEVAQTEVENEGSFEEPIKREIDDIINVGDGESEISFSKDDQETNGSFVHHNGNGVAHTVPEIYAGDKEVEVRLNGSSSVKSSDTAVGLKYVESLLGESSSSVNFVPPDIISSAEQNTVNGTLENEQQEPAPEVPEYDVEGVLQKQETHDLYCPNCNSCITKRVILRRRKRKIQEISTGEGFISSEPTQTPPAAPDRDGGIVVEQTPQPPRVEEPSEAVDAVTCLSCFSIFIPTGKGFLFWRAAQKPTIVVQPDQTSTEPPHDLAAVESTDQERLAEAQTDNDRGKNFPMWILTCCQPSWAAKDPDHLAKPDEKIPELESKPPQTSGVEVPGRDIEPPLPPSYETPDDLKLPASEPPIAPDAETPEDLKLSASEPSVAPDAETPEDLKPAASEPSRATDADGTLTKSPPQDVTPVQKPEEETLGGAQIDNGTGKVFPMWILECCQPSEYGNKPVLGVKLDEKSPEFDSNTHHASGPKVSEHEAEPPLPPSTVTPEDPKLPASQSPITPGAGTSFPMWILTCCQPTRDENRPDHVKKPDVNITKLESEPPVISDVKVPERGIESPLLPSHETPEVSKPPTSEPPKISDDETPEVSKPPTSEPPKTSDDDADSLIPHKPVLDITPDGDMPVPDKPKPHVPDGGKPLSPDPQPPKQEDKGDSVIITMPAKPGETTLSVIAPDPTPSGTGALPDIETPLLRPPVRPRPGVSGLDIIKAIVYGGLLESIASLSVISSAAAGDASTLNIVALGLANVFGGLIVLLHNLRVLKHEHTTQHYEEQLGRRGHFCLHATLAVISYLVFGLMPPIVYGFSFRESDDKNFKLITLAAASLVCILILSIGKAYVRMLPPKGYMKTVSYYITTGIMVSGLSYAAGMLINELLKKLGLFESSPSLTAMPAFEAGSMKQAVWSSY